MLPRGRLLSSRAVEARNKKAPETGASIDWKAKSYGVVVIVVVVVVVSVVMVAAGVSVIMVSVVVVVVVSSTTAGASVVEVSVVVVVSSFLVQPVRSAVPNTAAITRVPNFFISLSPSRNGELLLRSVSIYWEKASA
jgi:hypothetical protein